MTKLRDRGGQRGVFRCRASFLLKKKLLKKVLSVISGIYLFLFTCECELEFTQLLHNRVFGVHHLLHFLFGRLEFNRDLL